MQVIAADRPIARAERVAVLRGLLAAVLLLAAGLLVGWLCLGTPFLAALQPGVRPTPAETLVGMVAWTFGFLVPAGFVLLGVARGVGALDHALALRPRHHAPRAARELGDDHLVATGLRLPDGRRIDELVFGPFGLAVLGDTPPPHGSRSVGGKWEIRDRRGRWMPIESPQDRTARDADRLRRWLASHERDFVVRVHAAVVSDDPRVTRTPSCAVIRPHEVAAWLRALPPQRGLTPARRDEIVALLRTVAGHR